MNIHEKKVELFNKFAPELMDITSSAIRTDCLTDKQWDNVKQKFAYNAEKAEVIGFLDTSVTSSGKSGYLFTDE